MWRRFHSEVLFKCSRSQCCRALSLTPEFKSRFYFPLKRLDQMLDGTYPKERSWVSKWKAYLLQFHKLRIDQITDMLHVCAKRRVVPQDLWNHLRSVHWTGKLAEAPSRTLASALHSLALLNDSRQLKKGRIKTEPFTAEVLRQALQRKDLDEFSSVTLSQCLYAFALLDMKGHPLLALYSAEFVQPHRRAKLTTQSIANVLWSWAKLHHTEPAHLASLSAEAASKSPAAKEQELANIVWAWSVLGYSARDHWKILLDEIRRRFSKLDGQGLSAVFVASARVGIFDEMAHGALLQHIVQAKKLVLFSTRVLSNLIWALGKLHYRRDDAHLLALVQEALKASRLESASPQELCCITVGLSYLDHQDNDQCRRLFSELTKVKRLGALNHQELCNVIWAVGKMTARTDDCQRHLASEIVRRKENFDQFSAQGLVSVVVGWAHGSFPEKEDSNVVFREVMKNDRLKRYNPQELANLCWAFGRLGVHSTNIFGRLADPMLQEDRLSAFTPQALASILVGWAHGRFNDPVAIDAVAKQLMTGDKLTQLKSQEVANICWALGKLKCQETSIVKAIALEAARTSRLKSFTPLQLSIILLGWSKSNMRDFHLWDRILAEFSSRPDTLIVDMPILHNLTLAVQNMGFKGIHAYKSSREAGSLM